MELLRFVLLLVSSFLGLMIGMIVSNMAVEEISNASRYLRYLNIFLAPLIILVSTYVLYQWYSVIFSVAVLLLLIIFRSRSLNLWIYAGMGAMIYMSTLRAGSLNAAILITLYGISIATIEASMHFKNRLNGWIKSSENFALAKKMLSKYSYYLLIGIASYAVFTYIV